jgi:hypothetical protein
VANRSGWPMIATMMGVEIFLSNPDLLEKLFVAIILKYLMKKELS